MIQWPRLNPHLPEHFPVEEKLLALNAAEAFNGVIQSDRFQKALAGRMSPAEGKNHERDLHLLSS
jgi:hypothetical protein